MARIAGIDIPKDKRVEAALQSIFGIGPSIAKEILEKTGVNPDTRVRDLTEDEVNLIRDYIDKNVQVEGDLRREVALNIKRLVEIAVFVTVRAFPYADSIPSRTHVRARDPRRLSAARKKPASKIGGRILWQNQLKRADAVV